MQARVLENSGLHVLSVLLIENVTEPVTEMSQGGFNLGSVGE